MFQREVRILQLLCQSLCIQKYPYKDVKLSSTAPQVASLCASRDQSEKK